MCIRDRSKPLDQSQRLLDVAVTEPEKPMILYATFKYDFATKNSVYNPVSYTHLDVYKRQV